VHEGIMIIWFEVSCLTEDTTEHYLQPGQNRRCHMLASSCSTRPPDLREGTFSFLGLDLIPLKRNRNWDRSRWNILLFVPRLVPGRVGL
jgi:hypothetical protein